MSLIQKEISIPKESIFQKEICDLDKICSSYISFENPKYIEIDGIYYAALLVIRYAREMEAIFLDAIIGLDIDVQISMYYDKKNSYEIIKELTYYIGNTGATIKTSNQNQRDFEVLGGTYNDAKYIRKQLQMGEEELFYYSLFLGTFANTLEELERNLQRIESIAISAGLTTIRATYRQEDVFYTMLPFLKINSELDKLTGRNVLSSGLVSTYPFISNALYDKDGVLIGTNSFDNSLVLLNRFETSKYKNANMFVVGTSGSGKSYFIKLLLNRNRFLNIQQFVIDPDREYQKICEKLGGTIIRFGAEQVINVFDIREISLEPGESFLRNKISKLNIFFSCVFSRMSDEEKAILEKLLIECYAQKGIFENNESLYEEDNNKLLKRKIFKSVDKMPVLSDLWVLLKKDKKMKKYATILNSYISGSMKFLNNITNINTNNPLIVVDIHEIAEEELPTVMFIITDFFWDCIKEKRAEKKILYLDEVWKMINKNSLTADFVFKLFKTIRKYGGAATAITQDINDFFFLDEGKYGKGILNNSSIKCLFQMEENDISVLEKVMILSQEERAKLINMPRGTALIHAGRNRLLVDIIASEKEHSYISTDRSDLEKME